MYDDFNCYSLDPNDLKIELQASKQREPALEAALAEKEFAEEECRKKVEEAKKREASLENDLANMWVLVAKLKKEGGAIPDSKSEESVNVGDIVSGQKINGFDVKDVLMEIESLENIRSVHDTTKEEPLVSSLKDGVVHPSSIWRKARFGEDTIITNINTGLEWLGYMMVQ